MVQLNFDATQVAPNVSFEALPAGWYIAKIVEDELKPTKSGTGRMLNQKYQILDGPYAGRYVFGRLNIKNDSAEAEKIGQAQLSAIAHAVGQLHVGDSQQLYNIPMKIRLKYRAATGEYDAQNDIVDWKNINEVVPMGGEQGGVTQAQPVPNLSSGNFNMGGQPQQQPQFAQSPSFGGQPQQQFAPTGQPMQQQQFNQNTQPVQTQYQPQQQPQQTFNPQQGGYPTQQQPQGTYAPQQAQQPAVTQAQKEVPPWERNAQG